MITQPPALSVIVPVYKAEKFLSDCVDSILNQTFRNLEVILVDDGSPDGSGLICDEYAGKDSRIKVIHKPNGGASSARNAGLDHATGKYIGWVDADDMIAPDMYEMLMNLIEEYKADIADSQFYSVYNNKKIKSGPEGPVVSGTGEFILREFFSSAMKPGLTTKLYKRELWKNIQFPLGRNHQDCYINMRFALMPLTYVRTCEARYFYIIREKSITTTRTSHEIRQAIYRYEYTLNLAETVSKKEVTAKKLLLKDAINRLLARYFDVSVNSKLKTQFVYNYYIRKKLGILSISLFLLHSALPLKTKISYALLLSNNKSLQVFLHKTFGKRSVSQQSNFYKMS